MSDKAFNLIDEKWVRVMMPDCSVKEVSLSDAICSAHSYKGLAGEMEVQNIALLRLLIAIVHTVFTRVDLDGNESPVEDEKTAVDRWAQLMESGRFPEQPIRDYLSEWHERFWLFHPERPFYQVQSAERGTPNTVAKLNGEVSESNNKARLFSLLTGDGRKGMSFSESVRWLLFLNGFDDCAAKQKKEPGEESRSMTIAWLGKLGLVHAVGSSLHETVLLNMPMLTGIKNEIWEQDDLPVWEMDQVREKERVTIETPQDLASLMTLQSRRIKLIAENGRIIQYRILGGDMFSEQNALCEPMTLWRTVQDKKTNIITYYPRRHERSRQIWRDFRALVYRGENEIRPGVVSWCGYLEEKRILSRNQIITFQIAFVRYDSSQSSSITDSFADSISFHMDLLAEAGQAWIKEINHQLERIEKAAFEVGRLAENLGKAAGQTDEKQLGRAAETSREQFYLAIDMPFREWLLNLNADQKSEERNNLIKKWQTSAWRTAAELGRELAEEQGDAAFIGRIIKDKDKQERHYSSPEAYRWFRHHLNMIYPYTQEDE